MADAGKSQTSILYQNDTELYHINLRHSNLFQWLTETFPIYIKQPESKEWHCNKSSFGTGLKYKSRSREGRSLSNEKEARQTLFESELRTFH